MGRCTTRPMASWRLSDVQRLVVTVRFRGRCCPSVNQGQEMVTWEWGPLQPGGFWFREVWGHRHGGPTVWMNLILKAKFKPLWMNKGGTRYLNARHPAPEAWPSHREAGHSPTPTRPMGKHTAPSTHTTFGLLRSVWKGQISEAGKSKKLVAGLQKP